jgi:hypothetical protein
MQSPESSGFMCLVCMDPIDIFALGECNHRNICGRCSLKQRMFHKDLQCMMCKAALATVIYTTEARRPYAAFDCASLR